MIVRSRGYLPHHEIFGSTYFITIRLADTLPQNVIAEIKQEIQALKKSGKDEARLKNLQSKKIQEYLDKGTGECWLGKDEIAEIVGEAITHHEGSRYDSHAWCIMPNHVHVLFKVGSASMSEIVGGWKKHTARLANRLLGQSGAFWAEDYFDTYMRGVEHERKTVRYIESNPAKAKLVLDPKEWPWSSVRFRDDFGMLKLPV